MQYVFLHAGNTRVIKQSSLQKFQEEMETVMKDPYRVVMKQRKLPMSLFYDRIKPHVGIVHLYRVKAGLCGQRRHEFYLSVGDCAVSVQSGEMLCSRSIGRGN